MGHLIGQLGRSCPIAASLLVLASPVPALALDPHKALDQYIHDGWSSADGLPQNSVRAMAQTPDGYLWLGTEEGLVRFDGVRFFVFDKTNTASIATNMVNVLAVDKAGVLWIGLQAPGLCRFIAPGRIGCIGGTEVGEVSALAFDAEDIGWVGTSRGIALFEGGAFRPYAPLPSVQIRALAPAPDGAMLVVTEDAAYLARARSGTVEPYRLPAAPAPLPDRLHRWLVDKDQNLWASTIRDLYRLRRGASAFERWIPPGASAGKERIMSLLEDREGSLWIGAGFSGLHRLRDGAFTPYGSGQGLPDEHVRAVYVDAAGTVYAGGESGGVLVLGEDGRFRPVLENGWPNDTVWAVFKDEAGALWAGTYAGADRLDQRGVHRFAVESGAISFAAMDGAVYVGTGSHGLGVVEGKSDAIRFITEGLPKGPIHALHALHTTLAGRALWIGTERGPAVLKDGTIRDLSSDFGRAVYSFHESTSPGGPWMGTRDSGLVLGRKRITSKDGLFNDTVFTILDDRAGRFWMSSDKGIYTVPREDLEAFLGGARPVIVSTSYGVLDGLPSQECDGPAGARGPDGRLWFPTIRGLASIDPDRPREKLPPPPVLIEALYAGTDPIPIPEGAPIRIEPGRDRGRLEIRYTANSFVAPARIRFRYRLAPVDREWIDAGGRRSAFYTNLPPGAYRFEVRAMNADGVWSTSQAALELELRPRFHETRAFFALAGAAFLLFAYGLFKLRVRSLEAQKSHLAALVEARTRDLAERNQALDAALASIQEAQSDLVRAERMASVAALVQGIAHELNNPIGFIQGNVEVLRRYAGFLGRIAAAFSDGRPRSPEELAELTRFSPKKDLAFVTRDLEKVIEDVLDGARRASLIVQDLQSLTPGSRRTIEAVDLAEIAERTVRLMSGRAREGAVLEARVEPVPRLVARAGELEQVLVNLVDNALRALGPNGRATVTVKLDAGEIAVSVKDDGCGMSEAVKTRAMEPFFTTRPAGQGSGLGLSIVATIVKSHHGRISIESEEGRGTEVVLRFPLSAGAPDFHPPR